MVPKRRYTILDSATVSKRKWGFDAVFVPFVVIQRCNTFCNRSPQSGVVCCCNASERVVPVAICERNMFRAWSFLALLFLTTVSVDYVLDLVAQKRQ